MTTHEVEARRVPEPNRSQRMALALEEVGINRTEMAHELGTTPEAIRRWMNGFTEPKRHVLIAWASVCGVNLGWLETGEPAEPVLRARRDSNPQPSDLEPVRFRIIHGPRNPAPSTLPRPRLVALPGVQPDFTPEWRLA